MDDFVNDFKLPGASSAQLEAPKKTSSSLYSEEDAGPSDPAISNLAEQTLLQTAALAESLGKSESWARARTIVEELKPLPWFIWRLSNQVLGRDSAKVTLLDSNVMGLRRLLFAAASSPIFGKDQKVSSVREALAILKPDVVAAVATVHATVRKMQSRPLDLMWKPFLDEAVLRARIGFEIGRNKDGFGGGRGLLAGFASSVGLPILIAAGTLEQASQLMDAISQDKGDFADEAIYGTTGLQVGAMFLASCGVSNEAAMGFVEFANTKDKTIPPTHAWASCAYLIESIRQKKISSAAQANLDEFGLDAAGLEKLSAIVKLVTREGHGMSWIE